MIAGVLFCSTDCSIIVGLFFSNFISHFYYFAYGHGAYLLGGPGSVGTCFLFLAFDFRYSFFNAVAFLGFGLLLLLFY